MPEVTSKSQKLMLELGIIHQATPGCFHFLPLGLRALEKLVKIVDNEMLMIGGQKILFSELTNTQLWKKSDKTNKIVFTLRHSEVSSEVVKLLGVYLDPLLQWHTYIDIIAGKCLHIFSFHHFYKYVSLQTYEEVASNLISLLPPYPQKHFPLKLYQISNKFRDEMKPRFGLMRGREFLMKDMYSFDTDETSAKDTYNDICASYDRIFDKLDMECVKGDTGNIGGTLSHEYQFKAPIGEDCILSCNSCSFSANLEVCNERKCPKCGEESNVSIQNGIEVGHTFLLGDKYSKPKAFYLGKNSKPQVLHMGSYGLGLSRILAACVEVLSTETDIVWPDVLVPYNVVILPPKVNYIITNSITMWGALMHLPIITIKSYLKIQNSSV
nr:unnamed protein product [Callosobruchus analis]